MFTATEKRRIAALAQPIRARIDAGHRRDSETDEPMTNLDSQQLLDIWKEMYSTPTTDFDDRLRRLGVTRTELEPYIEFNYWPSKSDVPSWVDRLDTLLDKATKRQNEPIPGELTEEIPFVDILYPVTRAAFDGLDENELDFVSDEAAVVSTFMEWCTSQLARVGAQALHVEFRLYKRASETPEPEGTTAYEAFTDAVLSGGFKDVFLNYPVFGRFLVRIADRSVSVTEEFFSRLVADQTVLKETFPDVDGKSLTAVAIGKGDPHCFGRTVIEATFEDTSLYYKPRDVGTEVFFHRLCENLLAEENGANPAPQVVRRDEYGWIEEVERMDATSREVERYYEHIGSLLATLYALNASDIHYENLIASGAYPVLIDGETIVTRSLVHRYYPDQQRHRTLLQDEIRNSVLGTMMLPYLSSAEDGRTKESLSVSAIARLEAIDSTDEMVEWNHVNTDLMTFEFVTGQFEPSENFPKVDGKAVHPESYRDAITRGFKSTYDELRGQFGQTVERLVESIPMKTRYLFRPTSTYYSAINTLVTPRCLRNAAIGSVELDRLILGVQLLSDEGITKFWPIIRAERTALFGFDIPRFTIDERDLYFRHEPLIENFFDKSNEDIVSKNIENMSESDKQRQVEYIETTLAPTDAQLQFHRT